MQNVAKDRAPVSSAPPQAPSPITLADRAMIVRLHFHRMWKGTRKDKRLTDEVIEEHDLDAKSGYWRKHLVPEGFFDAIGTAQRIMKDTHEALTLPWDDVRGGRIARIENIREVEDRIIRQADDLLVPARKAVIERWPSMIAEMRNKDPYFSPHHYPDPSRLNDYWRYTVLVQPVRADWRTDLPDEIQERYAERWERHLTEQFARSMRDPWMRLFDVIEKQFQGIEAYQKGEIKTVHKTTLVENIKDVLDVLPALNIADDPELTKMADMVRTHLLSYSPEEIRTGKVFQDNIKQKGMVLMDHMRAYVGDEFFDDDE